MLLISTWLQGDQLGQDNLPAANPQNKLAPTHSVANDYLSIQMQHLLRCLLSTLSCSLVLSLCRSCLSSYVIEISWVIQCHVQKTRFFRRSTGPLAHTAFQLSLSRFSQDLRCKNWVVDVPPGVVDIPPGGCGRSPWGWAFHSHLLSVLWPVANLSYSFQLLQKISVFDEG